MGMTALEVAGVALPNFLAGKRSAEATTYQRLENDRNLRLSGAMSELASLHSAGYKPDSPEVTQLSNYVSQLENYSPIGTRAERMASTDPASVSASLPGGQREKGGKGKKGAIGAAGSNIEGMLRNIFLPQKFNPLPSGDLGQIKFGPSPLEEQQIGAAKIGRDIGETMSRPHQEPVAPPLVRPFGTPKEQPFTTLGGPTTEAERRERAAGLLPQISELAALGAPGAQELNALSKFSQGAFAPPQKLQRAPAPVARAGLVYNYNPTTDTWDVGLDQKVQWKSFKVDQDRHIIAFGDDPRSGMPVTADTGTISYERPVSDRYIVGWNPQTGENEVFSASPGGGAPRPVMPARRPVGIPASTQVVRQNDKAARAYATARDMTKGTASFDQAKYDDYLSNLYGGNKEAIAEHKRIMSIPPGQVNGASYGPPPGPMLPSHSPTTGAPGEAVVSPRGAPQVTSKASRQAPGGFDREVRLRMEQWNAKHPRERITFEQAKKMALEALR